MSAIGAGGPPAVAERASFGRSARERTPRSSHGDWKAGPERRDPIAILREQGTSRVPELLPIRYGRMAGSPFAFFRGAAAVMAADLGGTLTSGLQAQLCGDAHLSNFGIFASPERELLFDINDFDETLPGPFEWDLKRLAASMAIAGRELELSDAQIADVLAWTAKAYRESMRAFARMGNLAVWYAKLNAGDVMNIVRSQQLAGGKRIRTMQRRLAKARGKDSTRAVAKLTERVGDSLRFRNEPPLIVPIEQLLELESEREELRAGMRDLLGDYRRSLAEEHQSLLADYRFEAMARKVVGVGSVGTRAWVLLLVGRDGRDPLVLQAKEARESVLEPFAGKSRYSNHGERVVQGQRLMQAAGDIFLGWLPVTGVDGVARDFYVRQLWDGKLSVEVGTLDYKLLRGYGALCAWTLARAHARSGDRVAIASYLGKGGVFDQAIVRFAHAYADQNERDHAVLVEAIGSGRLQALDA